MPVTATSALPEKAVNHASSSETEAIQSKEKPTVAFISCLRESPCCREGFLFLPWVL